MDLNELRCFKAVVECGTLSKAAAHLRLAQPALSRKIQKIEHELGVQLLRRTPRGVFMTEAGQVLLNRAIRFADDFDEMRREMARYAERPTGRLKVAIQSPLSLILAPKLLRVFQSEHPEIKLELTEGFSGDLVDALLNSQVDLAVADTPSHAHADLTYTQLWVEPLQLFGAPGRLPRVAAADGEIPLSVISELPIIMPAPRHAIRHLVDAAFKRQQMKFQPAVEVNGAQMIMKLVQENFGFTIMPVTSWTPWITSGELETVKIKPMIRRTISVITKASLLNDPRIIPLRDAILALARTISGEKQFSLAASFHR